MLLTSTSSLPNSSMVKRMNPCESREAVAKSPSINAKRVRGIRHMFVLLSSLHHPYRRVPCSQNLTQNQAAGQEHGRQPLSISSPLPCEYTRSRTRLHMVTNLCSPRISRICEYIVTMPNALGTSSLHGPQPSQYGLYKQRPRNTPANFHLMQIALPG